MTGYNDEALLFMLDKLKEDDVNADQNQAKQVFNLALTYDIDYMVSAGIIKEGAFTDEYYDEDDAFDFIIDRIGNAIPSLDGDVLADLVEKYFDYHDLYMEQKGLLYWE
ncbi:MAG: hypothetical protein E7365_05480 [Clostridiales bacterium]|nr:hypothetical protein [Clostridiales bacterium]